MRNWFRGLKLNQKFTVTTLIFIFIPLFGMMCFGFRSIKKNAIDHGVNEAVTAIDLTCAEVNAKANACSMVVDTLQEYEPLEKYVKGREFSVGVIEGKALPIIEIAPVQGFYDYKNKYKAGSAVETCPAELSEAVTEKMQHYAEQVAQVLGLDTYSRTDFLLDEKENIYCLEANTLPGMTPTSLLPQEAQVVGVNFNELCEKLIQISLDKYEK